MTESEFWRSQGYEWVEGGEGGSWQYTGRFPTPEPAPDKSLGQYKIAATGVPKTFYERPSLGTEDSAPGLGVVRESPQEARLSQAVPTTVEDWATWTPTNLYTLREGGEGSGLEYAVNPYQETAKLIAAQPKSISPEELIKKYPSLAQLPKSTINAMAGDWRNVYGQMTGFLSPAKTKEGYEAFRPIVQQGTPILSLGGEGEILPELAKYVTYSPEYGLIAPQGSYRPYKEKFGIMSLAPALMLGAALGPLAGTLGGGALGAAGAGAITGGLTSAMSGGDILKGALTGGITGGIGAAATPVVGGALQSAGITGLAADVLTKAAVSAGTAALRGSDPLQAALSAAVGTGVGGVASGLDALKDLDPSIAKAVTAAASGAARAAVTGGDPVRSALMGVADAGFNAALGALSPTTEKPVPEAKPETPAPVEFEYGEAPTFDIIDPEKIAATPTEKWIDQGFLVNEATPSIESLLAELGQQEEEQAGMQGAVLGYDPRLMEALQAGDAEQAAMVAALGQPSSMAAGKSSVAGAPKVAGTTPSAAPPTAPVAQSSGMDFGSLLALLGAAQQPQKEPPPIQVVGEIKPYEFSSDLLAGVYGKPRANMYGANEELLNMMRGS